MSSIGHRSTWSTCRFVEFDASVICHVFMHCFGSFLLQAMFWSLQVFAFKGQNIKLTVKVLFTCIAGAFTIMHKKATVVIYLVLQSTPTYINEMAGYSIIAPKLEKQNTGLKPEVIGCYYCFSPRRILRLPRYSLTFVPLAFPGHVHRYIHHGINDITVLLIWHEYKHYFYSEIRQIDKVCLDALLTFFSTRASCEEVRYAN